MKKVITTGRFTKVYESNGRFTKVYLGEDGGHFTKVTEANGDTVLVPQMGAGGIEQGHSTDAVPLDVMAKRLAVTPALLRTWTHKKAQDAAGKNAIPFRKHGNGLWFIPAEIDDWMARLGTHAPAGPSATALLKKLRQAGKRKPRAA